MSDPAISNFTPVQARRLARLLKGLGVAPAGVFTPGTEDALLMVKARAAGLVEGEGVNLRARPEAMNFLRRIFAADGEDMFASQHGERATVDVSVPEGKVRLKRNLDESPLSRLARMRGRDATSFLSPDAVAAGERLLADFTRGQLQPRVTARWDAQLSLRTKGSRGGQAELNDSAMAARARFSKAVDVMGPELSGVAIDACCFQKGLETVERERQWPARSAKLMLRAALMVLARHYAPPARQRAAVESWNAETGHAGSRLR